MTTKYSITPNKTDLEIPDIQLMLIFTDELKEKHTITLPMYLIPNINKIFSVEENKIFYNGDFTGIIENHMFAIINNDNSLPTILKNPIVGFYGILQSKELKDFLISKIVGDYFEFTDDDITYLNSLIHNKGV